MSHIITYNNFKKKFLSFHFFRLYKKRKHFFYFSKQSYKGLLLVLIISLIATALASTHFMKQIHLSALMVAIVLGMIVGNAFHKHINKHIRKEYHCGLAYAQKKLLRIGIILYGFRITFQQILDVGILALLVDVLVVVSILIIGLVLGVKVFKLSKELSILVSAGSAICGAAAILAVESSIKAKIYEVTIAVATVVIFGTISMFLFPYIVQLLGMDVNMAGLALGATVHEVAQVVAAGDMISKDVTSVAIIVKLTRVMLLLPVLVIIGIIFAKVVHRVSSPKVVHRVSSAKIASATVSTTSKVKTTRKRKSKANKNGLLAVFPWFALGFVLMSGINSLHIIPPLAINGINIFDNLILAMAMTALGIETNFAKIKNVGAKPFILAGILMLLLMFYIVLLTFINV